MSLKKFLLECLFPKQCYGCQKNNTWVCPDCLSVIQAYKGQELRHLKSVDGLIIAAEYSDATLKKLIKAFKFGFNTEIAIPLSLLLYRRIPFPYLQEDYLIIPIPLHKKRFNWRGFNQSELIAKELSYLSGWPLCLNLLKIKNTAEQASLNEKKRLENQRDAFQWQGGDLRGKKILLLDDIITTGATISEAAKVLRQAGAEKIMAVALAKG